MRLFEQEMKMLSNPASLLFDAIDDDAQLRRVAEKKVGRAPF
jgi:hypothetical protein